jgi:hypothetical protein
LFTTTAWRSAHAEQLPIVDDGKVISMKIFGMDKSGNIMKTMTIGPDGAIARELFEVKL